jgi:hypothetical protein
MSDAPPERDEGFGSELRRRQSPKFAREQRRRNAWAGLVGLGMGAAILPLGINSMRSGKWMIFGRAANGVELPGWVVVLIALAIMAGSIAVLWRLPRTT